jgi:hypothetical protein
MTDVVFENIRKECLRIEEDVLHSGKSHFNIAAVWSWVHYLIGIPMTIFAAWAGIDSFRENPRWSGYLSLITATLAALQTFMSPSDKSAKHKSAGTDYFRLKNQTRIFREIELDESDKTEAIKTIRALAQNRDDLNSISPSIPYIAYCLARRGINKGNAIYKADKRES